MLREAVSAYPDLSRRRKDTRHTIEDYYALPEDQRVELIDGVFYDMGAPALVHQSVIGDLYILFRECADRHDKPCDVYLSPCDVRLDMDHYTMVQPDLLVMCRDCDRTAILIEGAPDLIVEVISPATRSRDMILKLYKYQNAGVREYWVIDTKYKEVISGYSSVLRAATISIWRFFRATIRPTARETTKVRSMLTR